MFPIVAISATVEQALDIPISDPMTAEAEKLVENQLVKVRLMRLSK